MIESIERDDAPATETMADDDKRCRTITNSEFSIKETKSAVRNSYTVHVDDGVCGHRRHSLWIAGKCSKTPLVNVCIKFLNCGSFY